MMMGTYALLSALREHWKRPIHPVYSVETRYGPPWRGIDQVWARYGSTITNILLIVLGLTLVTTVARIVTDQAIFLLASNALLQALIMIGSGVLAAGLVVLMWLWPIAVAVTASGTIVRDREQQTWVSLLATPIAWNDLLTIKLASTLRWFNRPQQLLLWVQSILLVMVLIIAAGQLERLAGIGSPLLAVMVTALAGAQFAIGRVQDYSTACLIGLAASIHGETRQTASVFALLGSIGLVIGRILWTGILLTQYPVASPQAAILFLATGPTTTIILISTMPMIIVFLIGVPLIREILIRAGYRWVLAHLGAVAGSG